MSLGVTVSAPESDRFNYDRRALLARIEVATAGHAAEEIVYGDETTGAENDIVRRRSSRATWSAGSG